ncbi:LPXTG cell wall anchor domain-containing protein [Lacticaseibacillus sp. 53-4]|uniref:LPXTG cell wall anchor domain-containing protein n=1 Tax=Lacticaseibacillus sp. 53-4 TaxID=2799575 RepID=UPI001942B224|nr:LPXTG cell wall anchor domain-containing protein [Lacticaseibacillus sp. 53-4]
MMRRLRIGLIVLVLAVIAAPASMVSASTASGATVAEFVVTGKRPPPQEPAPPPVVDYSPHDLLPGTGDMRQLPNTGDRTNHWLVILGGVVIGSLGLTVMVRRDDREA